MSRLEAMRAAARLADSHGAAQDDGAAGRGATPAPLDPGLATEILETLRANKVPLVEIGGAALAPSPAWEQALADESRQKESLAVEFDLVSRRFAGDGIVPVLFKSAGGLPYRSSNLDLLVKPQEFDRAAALLEELGHLRLPHYREENKLLFRKFRQGRSVICVHLHSAVSWGRSLILPGEEVVERSGSPRGETGFKVASGEDLVLITLAHSLFETDQIRLADLRALRSAAREPSLDWSSVQERARAGGWSTGFCAILTIASGVERSLYGDTKVPPAILQQAARVVDGAAWARRYVSRMTLPLRGEAPPALPYPLSKIWSKLHTVIHLMRGAGAPRSLDERLVDLLATGWNLVVTRLRLRCRPPVLISLTGLDGSGKSSAIRVLSETMILCEIPTRVVWSRGGFTPPVRAAKRAARTMLGPRLPGPAAMEDKRRWLSGGPAGAAFATLVVIEQAIQYLIRVRLPRWIGASVVCDRFAYDTMADLEVKLGPGRGLARGAGALIAGLAPAPDLAILLRVDAAAAARRKPGDAPAGVLELQAASLDRIAAMWGLVVVDAGRPDGEVIGEVVDLALKKAFARFGGEPA